ncbi:MAG: calcium/sodium antiporter [Nitrospinota bacterium]
MLDCLLIIVGLVMLYIGAELLIRGSVNVALILGLRPAIIGLTVVAIGTSAPELVASIYASIRGSTDVTLGNVLGSNIANIGAVLAIGATITPLLFAREIAIKEYPILLLFTLLLFALAYDQNLSFLDGILLLTGLILFNAYLLISIKYNKKRPEVEIALAVTNELIVKKRPSLLFESIVTILGIAILLTGAYLLVESAVSLARAVGVSELIIGITIVAIGTSIPELATTVIATIKRKSDIAIGAIVGSNIYNIGLILGLAAIVAPIEVSKSVLNQEMIVMLLFTLALIPLAIIGKARRTSGLILISLYIFFILYILI